MPAVRDGEQQKPKHVAAVNNELDRPSQSGSFLLEAIMKNKLYAHILVGLGFGDEGKGTMTDFLCRYRGAKLVVRYNGGAQAAHNVVTDDGRHHTFTQFGSGTFVAGVRTLLSKFMLFDPLLLADEVAELSPKIREHALDRHYVDSRAPIITPFHVAANRIKEWLRGRGRHGSCGRGIGETAADLVYFPEQVVRAGNLADVKVTAKLLREIQARKLSELEGAGAGSADFPDRLKLFHDLFRSKDACKGIAESFRAVVSELNILTPDKVANLIRNESSIFEGAQGMLLDEWHGFHPYTTWSTLTAENAIEILRESGFEGGREITGVVRTYLTRHGAGPLVTEDEALRRISPTEHNSQNDWQGTFRSGAQDGVALRYAAECLKRTGSLDSIALTHLDILTRREIPVCDEYEVDGTTDADIVQSETQGAKTLIRNLIPNFKRDLGHQEALTKLLQRSKGVIRGTLKNPQHAIEYLEKTLGKRVRYLSFGQTPRAKQVR